MARRAKTLIPDDLRPILKAEDINSIFKYLESEFHLSKSWRIEFHTELLRQAREILAVEFFCEYLLKNIEPILKQLLGRRDNVSFAVVRYVLRDRIEGKINGASGAPNFYVSWKKG